MARSTISNDDEGKPVVNEHGDKIGIVSEVRAGNAYVDPDPGITDTVMSKLGWSDADEEDYRLEESRIEHITDDEIRLKSNL